MRNNLKVSINLDHLSCYDEADGWGNAEPYMWTVFFKIDGTTCRLNDSLMLEGTATVYSTPGSHGNLGNTDVDAGDTVPVPPAIGFQEMTLTPIPVPDFVKQLGTDDAPAISGCIVVLMEEDNVSDAGAESGHSALNSAVQNALDTLIPTLGVTNQTISDDDINNMTGQIQSQVENAVKNQQNFFENIWSWINADDSIGTVVWKFSSDQLLSGNPVSLQQRWTNDNGDWELFGNINSIELPSCPADVIKTLFDNLFGNSSSKKSMNSMHDFRDQEMKKFKGLEQWWKLAQRNSHYLKLSLKNKEVSEAALVLFKDIPDLLDNRERTLDKHYFTSLMTILKHMSSISRNDRLARKDINRSIDVLSFLQGKSLKQIFEDLSHINPARYPSDDSSGVKIMLKTKK